MILNERQRKEKLKLKQREEKRGPGMYNTDDIPKHVGHSVKGLSCPMSICSNSEAFHGARTCLGQSTCNMNIPDGISY